MKKLFSLAFCLVIAVITVTSSDAQAQVFSNRCCDATGIIRCRINPAGILGDPCWCNYQGGGYIC